MAGRAAYLRVGLLLLAALALGVGFVLFLGSRNVSQGRAYETYFRESVTGLDVGAAVRFRGVAVGQVTAIGLTAAEYGRDAGSDAPSDGTGLRLVLVRFLIDTARLGQVPDTASAIRAGLRARLSQQGLTGVGYVELDFVDPGRFPPVAVPWRPRAEYIPSMPSTFAQVQDAAQVLLGRIQGIDFKALADALTELAADLHGQLGTEGGVPATLADAQALLRTLTEAVRQADLPGLTRELRGTSTAVQDVAGGRQLRELLAATTAAANRFASVADKLPPLVAALQATASRASNATSDLQSDLAPVLRDARAAAADLRETAAALRRDPGQVLLGAPPPREGRR